MNCAFVRVRHQHVLARHVDRITIAVIPIGLLQSRYAVRYGDELFDIVVCHENIINPQFCQLQSHRPGPRYPSFLCRRLPSRCRMIGSRWTMVMVSEHCHETNFNGAARPCPSRGGGVGGPNDAHCIRQIGKSPIEPNPAGPCSSKSPRSAGLMLGWRPSTFHLPGEDQMAKRARLNQRSVTKSAPVATGDRPSRANAEAAVRTLIRWAGDDPNREGLVGNTGAGGARLRGMVRRVFRGSPRISQTHLRGGRRLRRDRAAA